MNVGNVYRVRPGRADDYALRHAQVWPEIEDLLRAAGVETYSIYLWGEIVFTHMAVADYDRMVAVYGADPVAQRWDEAFADILEYPGGDPATGWPEVLREVWSL